LISTNYRVPRHRIPYILKKGFQKKSKLFIIRHSENKESFSRYRTIVSKKIHKRAVDRNKLRRQIYEAIRTNIDKDSIQEINYDIILIPKKNIITKKFQEIDQDIKLNIIPSQNG